MKVNCRHLKSIEGVAIPYAYIINVDTTTFLQYCGKILAKVDKDITLDEDVICHLDGLYMENLTLFLLEDSNTIIKKVDNNEYRSAYLN
mgnify:CR=1 FL=1